MIKEAYCSYEIAKLLKEKGFDEPCYMSYWLRTKDNIELAHLEQHYNNYSDCMYAPTHQMACAWLREKNIFIYAEPFITDNLEGYKPWLRTFNSNWFNPLCKQGTYSYTSIYEEAVEVALKYALENLI